MVVGEGTRKENNHSVPSKVKIKRWERPTERNNYEQTGNDRQKEIGR